MPYATKLLFNCTHMQHAKNSMAKFVQPNTIGKAKVFLYLPGLDSTNTKKGGSKF